MREKSFAIFFLFFFAATYALGQDLPATRPVDERAAKIGKQIEEGLRLKALKGDANEMQAMTLFQSAASDAQKVGMKDLQLAAVNETGCLLLSQNKTADALEQFRIFEKLSNVDDARKATYLCNLAATYEKLGKNVEAFNVYTRAATGETLIDPAISGAYRTAVLCEKPPLAEVAKITSSLLQRGETNLTRKGLLKCIECWDPTADIQPLMAPLITSYAVAVSPPEFDSQKTSALAEKFPKCGAALKAVIAAYAAKPTKEFRPNKKVVAFDSSKEQSRALSELLCQIGVYYARNGKESELALGFYSAAFAQDHTNVDAATAYINLVDDSQRKLDPSGDLRKAFIEEIFGFKTGFYRISALTKADKAELVRLHSLLGMVFSKDSPDENNPNNPRSAMFQWQRASELQDELIATRGAAYEPNMQIPISYAKLLEQSGRKREAWEQYVKAIEIGARDSSNRPYVLKSVEKGRELGQAIFLSEIDKMRFDNAAGKIH